MVKLPFIAHLHGADYVLILLWLQRHIGKMTESKPVIWWEGNNWYMRLVQGKFGDSYCEVHFANKKHLKLFEKAWVDDL